MVVVALFGVLVFGQRLVATLAARAAQLAARGEAARVAAGHRHVDEGRRRDLPSHILELGR